jgi:hypothetical protein
MACGATCLKGEGDRMIDRSRKVYFAKCIGPTGEPIGAYKVGCSHGWNDRIKQLCVNLPFTVELEALVPGSFVMEAAVHIVLKEHRISGEYFHANEAVKEVVDRAAKTGNPFARFFDAGTDNIHGEALTAFMKYHDITLADACALLGFPESQYEKRIAKPNFKNAKVTAAVAIAAARRGQYVHWPEDALHGMMGKRNTEVERRAAKQVAA